MVFSAQEIRNIDRDGARGAIRFAWHTIPAFIVVHVGFSCHFADAKDIERAYIDAHGASLLRDTFRFIDDNRDRRFRQG
jgi:hypothetical protein